MPANDSNHQLPDAYLAPLQEAIARAKQAQGEDTVDLIFYTDPHHRPGGKQLRAAAAVKIAASELLPSCIVVGGDIVDNDVKESVVFAQSEFMEAIQAPECPSFPIKGNHDDNSIHDFHKDLKGANNVIFPVEAYADIYKSLNGTVAFDKGNETGLYYYYDVPDKKTRIVLLNSVDILYKVKADGMLRQNGQWEYAFSDRQVDWVEHTVFDFSGMEEGDSWKVVFFSHLPIIQRGVRGYVDGEVGNGEKLWKIMKQNRKHVVACLFGHVHIDQVLYNDGIPMISTLNAAGYRNYDESPERTPDTASETVFDMISIDYAKGELRATRFGAGEDRVVKL
ncbi:metallophosphoesterase [Paenibacillus sp. LHD-117]|uniref:metallophosphoesterase family protein n=1 Tax=Paenibacillus sp. LHD-117 TaxID=3071412 RepID=UPI0027E03F92|nr:metallophosphoesterase [Paenibacillus sp. LHD-117]MDQ6420548.1 metallophosphoesterase [Paenibacillus sp. LHD-117]